MAKRINFKEEDVEYICNSYQNGTPRSVLATKYNCTDKVIVRILEENKIRIRRMKNVGVHKRKFLINDNYFNINNQSHNSAYILGILASDGCVASSQNQIYIELQRSDKEILEKINIELNNERPVKDYHNNSKNYDNSKLYFFSQQIKQDLAQYNIIPNKTAYNNDFMENIESKYYIDYIRGYFDGDGCIKWTNGTITWQIDSTSLKTLKHIQKYLKDFFDIETKIVEKTDKSIVNLKVYRIYCYGYEKCLKLFQLFYENPPSMALRMERKQSHFAELLLKYKTHETPNLIL